MMSDNYQARSLVLLFVFEFAVGSSRVTRTHELPGLTTVGAASPVSPGLILAFRDSELLGQARDGSND